MLIGDLALSPRGRRVERDRQFTGLPESTEKRRTHHLGLPGGLGAGSDGNQHPPQTSQEGPFLSLLSPETGLLVLADLDACQTEPEGHRGHHRGDHCHHHDHREDFLGEDSERESDGGDDDLHRSPCVEPGAVGQRRPVVLAGEESGAEIDPDDLPEGGDTDHGQRDQKQFGFEDGGDIHLEPGDGEEDRGKHAERDPFQLVGDIGGKAPHPGEQDADGERPDHRLEVERLGHGAPSERQDDHQRQHPVAALHPVLDELGALTHQPGADGGGEHDEQHHHPDRGEDHAGPDRFGAGQGGDQTEQCPSGEIVDHPGGQHGLANVAAHQIEVHEHLGEDRDRRDGEGGGDKQGEHDAFVGVHQQ